MRKDFINHSKSENPYHVPEGYFGRKKLELMTIAGEEKKSKIVALKQGLTWAAGIAAALLFGWLLLPRPVADVPSVEITDADIETYLLEEYPASQIDEQALFSEISAESLTDMSLTNIDDKVVEDFIDENFDQTLHYEYL